MPSGCMPHAVADPLSRPSSSVQIREKDELQEVLQQKEQRWPYGPVGVPMDKRPVSAISRPFSPHRSPRGAAGGP